MWCKRMVAVLALALVPAGGAHGGMAESAHPTSRVSAGQALPTAQQAELIAADGVPEDLLGFSAALSADGSTALVGANFRHNGTGAAYVFVHGAGGWSQQAELTAADGKKGDDFAFDLAISANGDTALIGAPIKGRAYVFARGGTAWTQQAELAVSDYYIGSVSLSADGATALVGATHADTYTGDAYVIERAGGAFVFERTGSAWTQGAALESSAIKDAASFGDHVALSADGATALIGAPGKTGGSGYVFARAGTSWTRQARLALAGNPVESGLALSRDGATALIAATLQDGPVTVVHVFARDATGWTEHGRLTAASTTNHDAKTALAISDDGTTALVGIHGAAYLYARQGGAWGQGVPLAAASGSDLDGPGGAAALSGDGGVALVGAPGANNFAGAAFVFARASAAFPAGTPSSTPIPTATPTPPGYVPPPAVAWVRADPRQPRTLLAQFGTQPAILRSVDGGATWHDITAALAGVQQDNAGSFIGIEPPTVAPDGRHLYAYTSSTAPGGQLDVSADAGLHWQAASGAGDYGVTLALGNDPNRAYALFPGRYGPSPVAVGTTADGGASWTTVTDPTSRYPSQGGLDPYQATSLAADPTRASTVYTVIQRDWAQDPSLRQPILLRSKDAGDTWQAATLPHTARPINGFDVGTDPRQGPVLIGRTDYPDPVSDVRFVSADGGRTWTTAHCPGDHGGACPAFILDNVLGAGASYAFFGDGIYRFHGAGPAETRIAESDHLPFPLAGLLEVEGGARAGDPIYLLGKGTYAGRVSGLLWRSTDAGQSWQQVALGFAWPTHQPAGRGAGFLYVPAAGHSVAPPFVAAYRRLGPAIVGLPLTEAHYTAQGVYRQDFKRIRLELREGRAVVAPLGLDEAAARHLAFPPVPRDPGTPGLRYFPATRHTLGGAFLAFWQAHGGAAVFGAPISEPLAGRDGRGRPITQQWFENGRLETAPAPHGSAPVIVAALGRESLVRRGWLP